MQIEPNEEGFLPWQWRQDNCHLLQFCKACFVVSVLVPAAVYQLASDAGA